MLGVAPSHCGPEVVALAHSRGYAILYHYGGTAGVAQVNDTDLHGELSSIYIDLEQTAFNNQQMVDPGNIGRTLQNVLDDACAAWRCCDHRKGVKGSREAPAGWLCAVLCKTCLCSTDMLSFPLCSRSTLFCCFRRHGTGGEVASWCRRVSSVCCL